MRIVGTFIYLLAVTAGSDLVSQDVADQRVTKLIDEYIDQRYEGTTQDSSNLLKELEKRGVKKLARMEELLRSRRDQYPDTSELIGKVSVHQVQCQHVDYASRYFLYIPKGTDQTGLLPLIVVGHGGNSSMSPKRAEATAVAYLQAYRPVADHIKGILVAPASSRGWGQIGNSLIFSTISKVHRTFPIDPDRIYMTGQSMGGHLSYRTALSFPDRFGAVSPHSGGYDFVAKKSIGNLINVPGYAIWGVREPYGINKDNRTNRDWAKTHDLNWKFVEKNGGHTIYRDELQNVAEFFRQNPRNLYRKEVYIRSGGTFKFVKTWQVKGWPEHKVYSDSKPLRWNMRHWIEVEPRPESGKPLSILAIHQGENRIEVTSENVRKLSIFLHPKMVNFEDPISVVVNGKKLFAGLVKPEPRIMFELAREFDDRGRIFWGRIDLDITSDKEVKFPGG